MNLPYPHFGVPELKSLPASERSRVWRECVHPLIRKSKFLPLGLLLTLALINIIFLLAHEFIGSSWQFGILFGISSLAGSLISDWMAAWKFRPQIRRYLAENQIEGRS